MAITVTVVAPSPVFIGNNYVGSATASGGVDPYTYAVTVGSLPDGLTLDPSTGLVTGVPLSVGSFDATITATDSVAATGDGDFPVIVLASLAAPQSATVFRIPLKWNSDDCLKAGHQMARLFYDAIQQPKFITTLAGNLQQPIGLVKSLLFFVEFVGVRFPNSDSPEDTVIIESTLSGQRISLGVPADLNGQGIATGNVFLNGCVPFYANDDSPVELTLDTFDSNPTAQEINLRLFFCNFEIAPFFYATVDNTLD
jgi:hypothetical protein